MQTQTLSHESALPPGGWSYKNLATHWNCHVRTIRRLVANGTLETFYVAGMPRVTDASRRRVENTRAQAAA